MPVIVKFRYAVSGASSDGIAPIAHEFVSTFQKFEFGVFGSARAMISVLAVVLAAGIGSPSLEAKSSIQPVVAGNVAQEKAKFERQLVGMIEKYRSLEAPGACVINSLLFEQWLRKNLPDARSQQAEMEVETRAKRIRHRVVLFQLNNGEYVYDPDFGVQYLPAATYTGTVSRTEGASRLINALVNDAAGSGGFYVIPQLHKTKKYADISRGIYDEMHRDLQVAELSYRGKGIIAFQEQTAQGTKVGIYEPGLGTLFTEPIRKPMDEAEGRNIMSSILRQVFGGKGKYSVVRGAF